AVRAAGAVLVSRRLADSVGTGRLSAAAAGGNVDRRLPFDLPAERRRTVVVHQRAATPLNNSVRGADLAGSLTASAIGRQERSDPSPVGCRRRRARRDRWGPFLVSSAAPSGG